MIGMYFDTGFVENLFTTNKGIVQVEVYHKNLGIYLKMDESFCVNQFEAFVLTSAVPVTFV